MVNHKKFVFAFGFAFEGLVHAFKRDQNIRIHILITIVVLTAAIFLNLNYLELSLIIGAITLVFIAELSNTAIEQIVDFMVKEHVPEAKYIKDVAAGFTLVAAIGAALIGIIIFFPKIINLFIYNA